MPLIERLLHSMLADDAVRRCWWTIQNSAIKEIVNQHRRRHRQPEARLNSSRSGFQPDMSD
ncbi:MAG: hypothetical protein WC340_12585 [Kiritimatiellia bacterium]